MTLKQQILADSWNYEFPISNIQANHIVDLADEFAIGFASWCVKNELFYSIQYGRIETKSLLEIYKKEKGL